MFSRRIIAAFIAVTMAATGAVVFGSASPALARAGLYMGMTPDPTEYARMYSMYGYGTGSNPEVVRVFSSSGPPPWTDSRIQSLKNHGIVPFISWKTHNVTAVRSWLLAMPADIPRVFLTQHHEPEGEMSASAFRAEQVAVWNNAIQTLPAAIRSKVFYGAVLTNQWTLNTPGRSFATYDPGIGDFLGNDMYNNSWGADYQDPYTFVQKWRDYNTGGRMKFVPELGAISMHNDPSDTGRAAWINNVMYWLEATPGLRVVLWWDDLGTTGAPVGCTGSVRQFRLDKRHCNGVTTTVSPSVTAFKQAMVRNTR